MLQVSDPGLRLSTLRPFGAGGFSPLISRCWPGARCTIALFALEFSREDLVKPQGVLALKR